MRNLDDKIDEWRRQMIAGGLKASSILDELESHLREDIQQQIQSGTDEESAFKTAVRKMGRSELLKKEFAKVSEMKEARPAKVIGIACGLAALPLSIFSVPTFLTLRELSMGGRILGLLAVILTFLSIASWKFSHKFLPVIHNRRVRLAAAILCGLAGLALLCAFGTLLPTFIVPRLFAHWDGIQDGGLRPVFAMGISMLWAMALTAILGALGYGLEEAAQRRSKENAYV